MKMNVKPSMKFLMKNNVTQNMFPNVPPLMKPSMKLHMKTNVRQNMNSPVPQHMKMNVTQCKSYSITVTLLVVHKENILCIVSAMKMFLLKNVKLLMNMNVLPFMPLRTKQFTRISVLPLMSQNVNLLMDIMEGKIASKCPNNHA